MEINANRLAIYTDLVRLSCFKVHRRTPFKSQSGYYGCGENQKNISHKFFFER